MPKNALFFGVNFTKFLEIRSYQTSVGLGGWGLCLQTTALLYIATTIKIYKSALNLYFFYIRTIL